MRAQIIGNIGDSDTGCLGQYLDELGFVSTHGYREQPRGWGSLTGTDLLVLMGSDWSICSHQHPREIAAEISLIHSAVTRGTPIFAICFGAQLVSHAFGGAVTNLHSPEIGWHEVRSADYSELLARRWFQWHYDTFTVPSAFSLIASGDAGPQAMVGKRVLATQFHPEISLETIERWSRAFRGSELTSLGIDADELYERSLVELAASTSATTRLVDWFLIESNSDTQTSR